MTSKPPSERISRTTRLFAAVIIAIVALGITWMADRRLNHEPDLTIPYRSR